MFDVLVLCLCVVGLAGLAELRQKFEEDKAKVAKMKQNRKFKPF